LQANPRFWTPEGDEKKEAVQAVQPKAQIPVHAQHPEVFQISMIT